jgi:AmmeMemoRadiSam system protein A
MQRANWPGEATRARQRGERLKQLEPADQRRLIEIAKRSIEAAVCGNRTRRRAGQSGEGLPGNEDAPVLSAGLLEPAAAFVTLRERGELRGCIGLLRFEVPLWVNVGDAAAAAALDDPRFYPVTPEELPDLEVEISVLEPPVKIGDASEFQAGRHGIVVEKGMRRGLLLPQVAAEMGWGNREMLEGVCHKANLPPDAWRDPATRMYVFEAVCFGEGAGGGAASESVVPGESRS